MMKPVKYPEGRLIKWLISFCLALSCFAFSLTPGTVQPPELIQEHVEEVLSSKSDSESKVISAYDFICNTQNSGQQTRSSVYEMNILITYQNESHVAFHQIKKERYTFSVFHFIHPIVLPDSDDDLSPLT